MESECKICFKCRQSLPTSLFNKKTKGKDGLQNKCRDCSKNLNSEYYQDNKPARSAKLKARREVLRELGRHYLLAALVNGCVDCSENDPIVLDFDHVSGDKKYSISRMVGSGYTIDKIAEEISKCEVRCANCHRRKTAKDFNWWKLNNTV